MNPAALLFLRALERNLEIDMDIDGKEVQTETTEHSSIRLRY